uniref:Mitochondrial resolvase Ydc2 catalytic domain-containing protein n=1 Tax=viral metagenome TaxID=1070528 RepID=A0A6C0ERS0_9ZZZZ
MKILSIDVGIKNLAFCLFDKDIETNSFKIKKWDIVNICQPEVFNCVFIDKKKNVICNKPAKFKKECKFFCLKHSKQQPYKIPTSELKYSFINKQKNQKLIEIAEKYSIKYDQNAKKSHLIESIHKDLENNFLQEISSVNASKVDLITIGSNLKDKFNLLFSEEDVINYVIIENQISPIASRMKTIQGMIVQYFIMSNIKADNIEFVSASNKLKVVSNNGCDNTVNKITYGDRKKMGIEKCLEIITTEERFNNKTEYFNKHNKKDDLADSFLQGIWFINDRKL